MKKSKYLIIENDSIKRCKSENYNFLYNKVSGLFMRWGKTYDDDPTYSPFGPEIADIEITTKCEGVTGSNGTRVLCPFCYKANNPCGENMSLDTFKEVFKKIPNTLTQIAFGVDSQATSNPDIWNMMEHCRDNGIVPNLTVADIGDDVADNIVKYAGACAVSRYSYKDTCYNTVKKLTDRGLDQTNIHVLLSEETFADAMETLQDKLTDERLANLNAVVFLSLKKRGRGVGFTQLSNEKFKELIEFAFDNNIPIGFDSCSCNRFLEAVKDRENYDVLESLSEPCESSIFSLYINAKGEYYPCSFMEGQGDWEEGINLLEIDSFLSDVWYNEKTISFREKLLGNEDECRGCPYFDICLN